MSEEHVFSLLGRWLRLHHDWQARLPSLAVILAQPAPTAASDPAICRQHAEACAAIHAIREQAHHWGLGLERELGLIHPNYVKCTDAFRQCHAAYEPWIARLLPPAALPPAQLAPALEHAAEVTQALNSNLRLRLYDLHPTTKNEIGGALVVVCMLGGIVAGVLFFSLGPVLLGLGVGFFLAFLSDKLSGHAKAVARQKHFEDLLANPDKPYAAASC